MVYSAFSPAFLHLRRAVHSHAIATARRAKGSGAGKIVAIKANIALMMQRVCWVDTGSSIMEEKTDATLSMNDVLVVVNSDVSAV